MGGLFQFLINICYIAFIPLSTYTQLQFMRVAPLVPGGTRLESRSGRIFVVVVVHTLCSKHFKGMDCTLRPMVLCTIKKVVLVTTSTTWRVVDVFGEPGELFATTW